jgi:hypothetical protein
MSGLDDKQQTILAVLAKRTYQIVKDFPCQPLDTAPPLVAEPEQDPDNPLLLKNDYELYPFKLATDVVIKGHAYGRGRSRFEVSAQVGPATKRLLVLGDRACQLHANGSLSFSTPAPVDKVPLRYSHAYGGRDQLAEARHGIPVATLIQPFVDEPIDLVRASPFTYPRNPAGRGYLIEATPEAVANLKLPNLEDPDALLQPETLALGSHLAWPRMPIPQATDWVDYDWFPRLTYAGIVPDHDPPSKPIDEVRHGWAAPDILEEKTLAEKASLRLANGASLGLQVPYLKGGETVELVGMHKTEARLKFQLPRKRPRIRTDGRNGKLNETDPFMSVVIIEPDREQVTIVWCGWAPALRPYFPEELAKMPLEVAW